MIKGGSGNKQQGIFMDNGSGGWMTDLVFNGGNYGMFWRLTAFELSGATRLEG